MSSLIDRIKSLFLVEVPKSDTSAPSDMSPPESQKPPERTVETDKEEEGELNPGKPSSEFLSILINAMKAAAEKESVYLDFKQNIKSLNHLDFDQKTKYETAFAIASNRGVDKEALMKSARYFLTVLDEEQNKFDRTLGSQRQLRINNKKEEIKKLRDEIFAKQSEIEKIQEEIRQLEQKISTEKQELNDQREKIEKTAADFKGSLRFLKSKIKKDLENFNDYLD